MGFQIIPCKRKSFLIFLILVPTIYSLKDSFFNSDSILNGKQNKLGFEDEYKLFEEELEKGIAKHTNSGKSRQKRYVYLNTESNVDVGFLIVIPVSVVLPAMTNLFNNWRRKRSVANFYGNVSSDGDPTEQQQASKVSSYFDMINIPEVSCQLRAICDFSADPNNFFPLSDIILSKLKDFPKVEDNTFGRVNSTSESTSGSLFDLYSKAADDGITYGLEKCQEVYSGGCKYPTEKLLNMPIMKFWNKVQSTLRLKFEDVSEA